ncbi:MAG: hypothetical protein JJU36_11355 [Phycisphaeraceae bacterium]|nr:hypothetical protein [Phycisphaeraceae bacterium]
MVRLEIRFPVSGIRHVLLAFLISLAALDSVEVRAEPDARVVRLGESRPWVEQSAQAVAFAPSGSIAALGYADGTVALVDVAEGKHLGEVGGHGAVVQELAFSGDGRRVAARCGRSISVFDAENRRLIARYPQPTSERPSNPSLGLSQDGTRAMLLLGDRVAMMDVRTGELEAELAFPQGVVGQCLAMDNDRSRVGVGTSNGLVLQWDVSTLQPVGKRIELGAAVSGLVLMPDGKRLVAAQTTGAVSLLNGQTDDLVRSLQEPGARGFVSLACSADGSTVAARNTNGTLTVWRVRDGEVLHRRERFPHHMRVGGNSSVALSGEGRYFIAARRTGSVEVIDLTTGDRPRAHEGHLAPVRLLAMDYQSGLLASWDANDRVIVWNVDEQEVLGGFPASLTVDSSDLHIGRGRVKVAERVAQHASVLVWDTDRRERIDAVALPPVMLSGSFSPRDGSAVMTFTIGSAIRRWVGDREPALEELGNLPTMGGQVTFSEQGRWFSVVENDAATLWDGISMKVEHHFLGGFTPQDVRIRRANARAALAPDGSLLALATSNRQVQLFEFVGGGRVLLLDAVGLPDVMVPRPLAFAPGRSDLLLVGGSDGRLEVWDLVENSRVHRFPEVDASVTALAVDARSGLVAAGYSDGTVTIWRMPQALERSIREREERDDESLDRIWATMESGATLEGWRAAGSLARYGDVTVEFIASRLASAEVQVDEVEALIEQLGDERFARRERAYSDLLEMGGKIRPTLKLVIGKRELPDPIIERLEEIVAELGRPEGRTDNDRRASRAVMVLNRIGTPRAIALLERYARGAETDLLTQEAARFLKHRSED